MRRRQDQVIPVRQHRPLSLRRPSPEHKYDRSVLAVQRLDHGVGELLPAAVLVGICLVRPHREHGVEQKNALLSAGLIVLTQGDGEVAAAGEGDIGEILMRSQNALELGEA